MLNIEENAYNRILHDLVWVTEFLRKSGCDEPINKEDIMFCVKHIQLLREAMIEIIESTD